VYTDPSSNRQYRVDPATGQSVWLDEQPQQQPFGWPPSAAYPQQMQQFQPPAKRKHTLRTILLTIAGVFILLMVIGAIGQAMGGGTNATDTAATTTQSQPAAAPSSAAEKSSAPAPAASSPAVKPAPAPPTSKAQAPPPAPTKDPTAGQLNALRSAQNYLDIKGFSRAGLIAQLSSAYGDQFSVADSTWAVDHVGADWNEQAVRAGKAYLELKGFSRLGLIDQLSSAYGDQFTRKQATYAADKLGLK
jgi:hypothetical protein